MKIIQLSIPNARCAWFRGCALLELSVPQDKMVAGLNFCLLSLFS